MTKKMLEDRKRDWLRGRSWCGQAKVKHEFSVPAALYKRIFLENPHLNETQIRQIAMAVEVYIKHKVNSEGA